MQLDPQTHITREAVKRSSPYKERMENTLALENYAQSKFIILRLQKE